MDTSKDSVGDVPLLKTVLEGVEMTEKQLAEIYYNMRFTEAEQRSYDETGAEKAVVSSVKLQVFKKYGLVKEDPLNEPFDPNKHNAVSQVPDASKPRGTFANVLKPEHTLFDRVIRPAEVGATCAVGNQESEKESEA